jgi:hypothetical protein
MTGSVPSLGRYVNSPPGAGWAWLAAWVLGAVAPAAWAQDELEEVTLQVLDDVSAVDGVLMPLEEEPAHPTDSDPEPAPDASPPAEPAEDRVR